MKDLRGKNAIITGGSRGIGIYIARALAHEGANIALAARSADDLESVVQELNKLGIHAIAIPADITIESNRTTLFERAVAELGQVDILVNNAGILHFAKFEQQEEKEIARIIDTNLTATILLTRKVLPDMLKRGYGHIVNISSLAGKKGVPYEAVYAASKAGLIQWSNALSLEMEGTGIGASVLCPVYVADIGMFAIHGVPAPRLAGSVSPEYVAKSVVKALRKNQQELIVRPSPTRPLYALNELSPRLGNLIMKAMGVVKLQKGLAESRNQAITKE